MVCSWSRFQLHTYAIWSWSCQKNPIYPINYIPMLVKSPLFLAPGLRWFQRTEPRLDAIFGLIPYGSHKISAYLKSIGIAGFKGLVFQGHVTGLSPIFNGKIMENRGFPVKISLQPIHGWHMLQRLVSYQPKKSWYSHFTGTSHIIASNPLTFGGWNLKHQFCWCQVVFKAETAMAQLFVDGQWEGTGNPWNCRRIGCDFWSPQG